MEPKRISENETRKLFIQLKNGNYEARNEIIIGNYYLILYLAKKLQKQYKEINIEDLISLCSVSFVKAVDSFDLSKNLALSTYASKCASNELGMYFRKNGNLPTHISFDKEIPFNDGHKATVGDLIPYSQNMENEIITGQMYKDLNLAVSKLSEADQFIIKNYYGLRCNRLSQLELGEMFGLTQSGMHHKIKKSLANLRKEFTKNYGYQESVYKYR